MKETGSFINSRGQRLYTIVHTPDNVKPTAVLVFLHGIAEYCDRFDHVFEVLAAGGITVFSFDAHGHGRSEPTEDKLRCYVEHFEDLTDDLWQYVQGTVQPLSHGLPIFCGGQSLGGLIATCVVGAHQNIFAGLMLVSAAIDVEWTYLLRFQASIGNCLSTLMPYAKIVPAMRAEDMSADQTIVCDYHKDPLIYQGDIKARTANEALKGFKVAARLRSNFTIPIYATHGNNDKTTSLKAVKELLAAAQSTDKTLHEIEGGFHEMLMGPERHEVTSNMLAWLQAHSGDHSVKIHAKAHIGEPPHADACVNGKCGDDSSDDSSS